MLSPYGEGSIWVEEIKSTYFIVKVTSQKYLFLGILLHIEKL